MNEFIKLIEKESIGTIEGLTGQAPDLRFKEEEEISIVSNIIPPVAMVYATVSGDVSGRVAVAITPILGTALADLMLGGDGSSKDVMDSDDLDAVKEIISNIFGAISTTLNAQKVLPKLNFAIDDIKFFKENQDVDLGGFVKIYVFEFSLGSISSLLMFVLDSITINAFSNKGGGKPSSSSSPMMGGGGFEEVHHKPNMSTEELRNIDLLLDVNLIVKVRIGTKKMLLRDVINMDIGAVVELNQLANDPLDVLVDDKVIAKGEVVIIDGNFGVQITDIVTKKERLEKLRG